MSMIFAINIGITKSNSDKADAAFLRSRRQLALKDDISTCTDECITSNLYAVSSRTYTPKQLRVSWLLLCFLFEKLINCDTEYVFGGLSETSKKSSRKFKTK
jgi:hypothetical protein